MQNNKGIGNAFSSFGLLMHSLFERYAKGEIDLWDLPSIYEWEFDTAVPEQFPPMPRKHQVYGMDMRKLYYDQGLSFLQKFQGYSKTKILGVETKFDHDIEDWVFNGVIDLVVEENDGRLIVKDYKSKSSFKNKQEKKEYTRQLYLYALHVKEKYGRFPDELCFVMVRKNEEIVIPFNIDDFEEAVSWAKETVAAIRQCWDYYASPEPFFCQNLCNFRQECTYKQNIEGGK